MTALTFIAITAFILGIITLILVAVNRLQSYRRGLVVGALLLLAISVAAYLGDQNDVPSSSQVETTPTDGPARSTPTEQSVDSASISPISPVATPEPIVTEVQVSEIGFEGCLLFTSNSNGNSEIYKLQQNLDDIQQLTDNSGADVEPEWSPDGERIVFASNREAEAGFQIYMMNIDGSNQQRVGPVQPGDNTHPNWSPDGRQLIFQSKRDTNGDPRDDSYDIYIMNSDGTDINFLVTHSADDTEPTWSPDGNKIAFLSERSGQDEIYLMNPDGSEVTQLTELNMLKSGLNWSSDSQHIVFEGAGEIYSIDIETKQVTKLLSLRDSNEATPLWTQDQELLIFSSDRTGNWELYALVPISPTEVQLAQLLDNPGDDRNPSWFACEE